MAARFRVIILDRDKDTNGFHYVLWADVPFARQTYFADATKKSAWKDAFPTDVEAIQAGAVLETTGYSAFAVGSTMAQVQADMQAKWQAFQNEVSNQNPWRFYGSTWDGTTWVVTNIQ